MESTERVIISAQVDASLRDQLERLDNEGDRTLSAEVRRAIAEHVKHERPAALKAS